MASRPDHHFVRACIVHHCELIPDLRPFDELAPDQESWPADLFCPVEGCGFVYRWLVVDTATGQVVATAWDCGHQGIQMGGGTCTRCGSTVEAVETRPGPLSRVNRSRIDVQWGGPLAVSTEEVRS